VSDANKLCHAFVAHWASPLQTLTNFHLIDVFGSYNSAIPPLDSPRISLQNNGHAVYATSLAVNLCAATATKPAADLRIIDGVAM
jgi:hypothetical protein